MKVKREEILAMRFTQEWIGGWLKEEAEILGKGSRSEYSDTAIQIMRPIVADILAAKVITTMVVIALIIMILVQQITIKKRLKNKKNDEEQAEDDASSGKIIIAVIVG